MCDRVVAAGLLTVDVLAPGEGEMATGGMFVEPQLPMTHLQGSAIAGNAANRVRRLTVGDRSAEVGGWRNEHSVSNS